MRRMLNQATCHYEIFDTWLTNYRRDRTRYVDLREIVTSTSTSIQSQYLRDCISLNLLNTEDVDREAMRAAFIVTGVWVGTAGQLNGYLEGESWLSNSPWVLAAARNDVIFRRIYAFDATVRNIKIVGVKNAAS